jgi:single-stranded-DNA-specific exonuclease
MEDRGEESLLVDAAVDLKDLNLDTYAKLRRLAPFGQGNPAPRFFADKVTVKTCRSIGNAKHLRLTLSQGEAVRAAVWWWSREEITAGTSAETVFALSSNSFNGKTTLQLVIEAFSVTIKRETIYRLPPLSIIDRRYHAGLTCDLAFEGTSCDFAEGRECMDKVNRYTLQQCDNLILTTIPPHIKVLREMLSIARCKSLVLAFPLETVDRDPFIVRLMQALKFVTSKHGGTTSLEFLSAYTAALEITALQGMRLLRQSGHLLWDASGSQIQISLLKGEKISTQSIFYERMKQAEQESRAFREFMVKVEPGVLKKMLYD